MEIATRTVERSIDTRTVCLPNQNQLFAYYMQLCAEYGIKKPSASIVALLEEDELSRNLRLQREAVVLRIPLSAVISHENEVEADNARHQPVRETAGAAVIPLATKSHPSLCVSPADKTQRVHLGNRGICAWIRLLAVCPLVRRIDLSEITSIYDADAFRNSPSGNDVIDLLCDIAERHPSLTSLNVARQPIGTVAARRLLDCLTRNVCLTELLYDEAGVDRIVCGQLQAQLAANVRRQVSASLCVEARPLPKQLPLELVALEWVDRKTALQRQQLRNLLSARKAFSYVAGSTVLDKMVTHAELVSLETVVQASTGLRGDRQHLFLLESGVLDVWISNVPFTLARGDYFGHTYESAMFSAGMIAERMDRRGKAYRIPLDVCAPLLAEWEARVDRLYPAVKAATSLQSAHVWMLLRACHTATRYEHSVVNAEVVARGTPFAGLWVVESGQYAALRNNDVRVTQQPSRPVPSTNTAPLTNKSTRRIEELDWGLAANEVAAARKELRAAVSAASAAAPAVATSSGASVHSSALSGVDYCVRFQTGDVFGEDCAVLTRTRANELCVVVSSAPASAILLDPEGSEPILACQREVFAALARQHQHACRPQQPN